MRPIAVTSHVTKIFEKAVNPKLRTRLKSTGRWEN